MLWLSWLSHWSEKLREEASEKSTLAEMTIGASVIIPLTYKEVSPRPGCLLVSTCSSLQNPDLTSAFCCLLTISKSAFSTNSFGNTIRVSNVSSRLIGSNVFAKVINVKS